MKTIDRKLLRDLARMKGPAATIALVIAGGVAAFVGTVATYRSLEISSAEYYASARFADVFAGLQRAPERVADRLAEIPGVEQVETRVVKNVAIRFEDMPEPALVSLVSLPDGAPPALNQLEVHEGRMPAPDAPDEVVVGEAFAQAHRLQPGAELTAVLNGRVHTLRVCGIALSPEYIYVLGPGMMPDDRRFGVAWIARSAVDRAFDMRGAFNDVVIALAPQTTPGSVIAAIDAVLAPYGGTGAIGRDDQASGRLVRGELEQNRAMAVSLPAIFLGVASFLLNVVLARLIGTQRAQIATLKALGLSGREIGVHYAKLAMFIVLCGIAAGTVLGIGLGRVEMGSYRQFFRFHALTLHLEPWIPLVAGVIAVGAGAIGCYGAVRRVVSLPAAEAMRPEAPPLYRRGLLERLGLSRVLPGQALLVARSILRRPVRAAMTAFGIAAAVAVVVVGLFMFDAIDYFIDLSFRAGQRGDAAVGFFQSVSPRAIAELEAIPGVTRVEGIRGVPVRVRAGHHEYRTGLSAYAQDADLVRLLDDHGRPVPLPSQGIVLSDRLATRLGVGRGQAVELDVLEGAQPVRQAVVTATFPAPNGLAAAMDERALDRLLGQAPSVNGASLKIEAGREEEVFARLAEKPGIVSVVPVGDVIESFNETMGGMINTYVSMISIFAGVIAVGVVYNAARITFAERARELASLRILGFTRREVTTLLLGELSVELVAGIPVGWGFGLALSWAAARAFENDQISIPLALTLHTYAFATAVVLASAAASAIAVRRMLDRFSLVEVLKAGE